LEYISPADGRDAPVDLRSNDIAHWETRVEFEENTVSDARNALRAANVSLVTGAQQQGDELLAEDPDRHVIILDFAKPNAVSRITSATQAEAGEEQ
jgi:uncharacterized membrane protein